MLMQKNMKILQKIENIIIYKYCMKYYSIWEIYDSFNNIWM